MLADPYHEHFFTGKSGKKGKGWKGRSKSAAWAEHDLSWITKGKGKSDDRPTVNAYVQDMYGINGLEMHEGPHNPLELSSVSPGKVAPHQGMLDCGATASAGPEASVQRLIEAVLRQDKSATVTVDQSASILSLREWSVGSSTVSGDPPIRSIWPPPSLSCVCSSESPRVLRAMVHHRHACPDSGWHESCRF